MIGLSLSEARRITLGAQGFHRPRPAAKVEARHVRRVIRQLGLIQLDFVNVLVPAHYQVLFSRLGLYDRSILDRLIYQRREFTEHWAHEASIVPMEAWPLLRYRRETHRVRPWGFEKQIDAHADYVKWVIDEAGRRGPLRASDLPAPPGIPRKVHESWFTFPRAVLEAHFGRGMLAIANRGSGFARTYDLTERVIPPEQYGRRVEEDDARRELLRQAARAYGVATAADLADYYRMPVREASPGLAQLEESGELLRVAVEGWRERAYLHRDACTPRAIQASTLLSPFDPVVWYRPRAARLFGFDHRFEIFVPAQRRKWGCYVLPFLMGDRLVARVDLKADRGAGRLVVLSGSVESHAEAAEVLPALQTELTTLANWLGLEGPSGKTLLALPWNGHAGRDDRISRLRDA